MTKKSFIRKTILFAWISYIALVFVDPQFYYSILVISIPCLVLYRDGFSWLNEVRINKKILYSLLCFGFITLITQPHPNLWDGVDSIRKYHLKYTLIIFVTLYVLKERKNIEYLTFGFVFATIIGVLFGYYTAFTPTEWHLWENPVSQVFPGSISPFGQHKNHFGGFFPFLLPFVSGLCIYYFEKSKYRLTSALFVLLLTSFPVIVWSQSRTALISSVIAVVSVILLTVLKYKKASYFIVILIVSILIISSFFIVPWGENSFERWTNYQKIVNLQGRVTHVWPETFDYFKKQPWLGYDLSTGYKGHNEHNVYLFFLARSGILGLSGFVIFTLTLLWNSFQELIFTSDKFKFLVLSSVLMSFISGTLIQGIPSTFSWYWIHPILWSYFVILTRRKKL